MGCCASSETDYNNNEIADILLIDPECWTQKDIVQWLKCICDGELYELIPIFKLHQIRGLTFVKLTNDNLQNELNIKQYGLREQFIYQRDKLIASHHNPIVQQDKQTNDINTQNTEDSKHITCTNHANISLRVSVNNNVYHHEKEVQIDNKTNDINTQNMADIKHNTSNTNNSIRADVNDYKYCHKPEMQINNKENEAMSSKTLAYVTEFNWGSIRKETQIKKMRPSLHKLQIIHKIDKKRVTHEKDHKIFNLNQWKLVNHLQYNNNKKYSFPVFQTPDDYYVLQQYEHHCYLHCSKLVIESYFNQLEQIKACYIAPHEIRAICYSYYFEQECHILQFAYDVSRVMALIDHRTPRTPLFTFSGSALIEIMFNTHLRNKYRLKPIACIDVLNTYCNELMECDFLRLTAVKDNTNNYFSGKHVVDLLNEPQIWIWNDHEYGFDAPIKEYLYSYDKNKKTLFHNYEQFVEHKIDRYAWNLNTIIEIYSHSFHGWQLGKVVEIELISAANKDDIFVEYGPKEAVFMKKVNRFDPDIVKSTKQFITNRNQWDNIRNVVEYRSIEVFDEKYRMWFPVDEMRKSSKFDYLNYFNLDQYDIKYENEIQYDIKYEAMFGETFTQSIEKWSPNIRDATLSISEKKFEKDNIVHYQENKKDLIWSGFVRQHSKFHQVPSDIIRLLHQFCEYVIDWNIAHKKMDKLWQCAYNDVMIGPQFKTCDGIIYQLTLCPRFGRMNMSHDPHMIVCYLELKHVPADIKSITFSFQLYLAELQHDCRGTVYYDTNVEYKCNAWSWGKRALCFDLIEQHQLASFHISCSVDLIHVEYKQHLLPHKKDYAGFLLPKSAASVAGNTPTSFRWTVNNELLETFKYRNGGKDYFLECLHNDCWMISCNPNKKEKNDEYMYLKVHLMKLPIGKTSITAVIHCVAYTNSAQLDWSNVEPFFSGRNINVDPFFSGRNIHDFKFNMDDNFEESEYRIRVCKSRLLKCLSSLTFDVFIDPLC